MRQIDKRIAKLEQSAPDSQPGQITAIVYSTIAGGFQEGQNVPGHPNYEGDEKWPVREGVQYLPGHPLFEEPRKRYPLPAAKGST